MRERLKRHGRRYAAIPNDAMRDTNLSIDARGMLALLMTYSDEWVFNRDHLMSVAGIGKERFTRIMGELVEKGYVERVQVRGEGGTFLGRNWLIHDDPTEVRETQTTVTEVRENRSPAEPMSGKPDHIRRPRDKNPKVEENPTLFSASEEPQKQADRFDEFWTVYPKKAGKPAAKKAWDKAVKKTDPKVIIEGAKRYAAWLKDAAPGEFRPHAKHPQGWLNDERWSDDEIAHRRSPEQRRSRFDVRPDVPVYR